MQKTIASKSGGFHVKLRPEEIQKIEVEWKVNEAEKKIKEEDEFNKNFKKNKALDKLFKDLEPEEKELLKEMIT